MPVSLRADYPLGTARGCTCYVCGADRKGERVVDCELMIVDEGRLMICESCIREAAGLLGMVDPVERDEAIAAMHELQAAADEAKSERDEAYQLVDLLRAHDSLKTPNQIAEGVSPLPSLAEKAIELGKEREHTRRPRPAKTV